MSDLAASRSLYAQAFNIRLEVEDGQYLHTENLKGANNFALWPLAEAARSCFGLDHWPSDVPAPHAWLEFDVEDVGAATAELEGRGYRMLVKDKKEPWGQVVSRFLDPDGVLVGLTYTPLWRD